MDIKEDSNHDKPTTTSTESDGEVIAPVPPLHHEPGTSANIDDFLIEFDVSHVSEASHISQELRLQNEIEKYLTTKKCRDISDGLREYPTISKLFYKFNCIRSTEAICERLFSYAGE